MNRRERMPDRVVGRAFTVCGSTKRYVPVGNFEQTTGCCPMYIAWLVLDEARDCLRISIPDLYADELARRAEAVFATHEFWRAKYCGRNGREYLLVSMRHWLASVLVREEPA